VKHVNRPCEPVLDGDLEGALLRGGKVASADNWRVVLEPVIERYRGEDLPKFFRGDPAFVIPELYERDVSHLNCPVGRPPKKPDRLSPSFTRPLKILHSNARGNGGMLIL